MVLRTIRALAADNETEMCQLNVQDGGMAAEVIVPQTWRTAAELRDMGKAFLRMADVIDPVAPEGGA